MLAIDDADIRGNSSNDKFQKKADAKNKPFLQAWNRDRISGRKSFMSSLKSISRGSLSRSDSAGSDGGSLSDHSLRQTSRKNSVNESISRINSLKKPEINTTHLGRASRKNSANESFSRLNFKNPAIVTTHLGRHVNMEILDIVKKTIFKI